MTTPTTTHFKHLAQPEGCGLLAVACWLLDVGCWLLAVGSYAAVTAMTANSNWHSNNAKQLHSLLSTADWACNAAGQLIRRWDSCSKASLPISAVTWRGGAYHLQMLRHAPNIKTEQRSDWTLRECHSQQPQCQCQWQWQWQFPCWCPSDDYHRTE